MKKRILFLFGMLPCLFASVPATGQDIPVSNYRFETGIQNPAPEPSTWTECRLDGLTNLAGSIWLDTENEPVPLSSAPSRIEGMEIGFSFPFAGQTFERFGLTGDGLIYLCNEEGFSPVYSSNILSKADLQYVIQAMPCIKILQWNLISSCNITADDSTRIKISSDQENGRLFIRYQDIKVQDMMAKVFRWRYTLCLHENGDIEAWFDRKENASDAQSSLGLIFALKAVSEDGVLYADDWDGTTILSTQAALDINGLEPEEGSRFAFRHPVSCTQPEEVRTQFETLICRSHSMEGRLSYEGTCDYLLAILSEEADENPRPQDMHIYTSGDSIGNGIVVLCGNPGNPTTLTLNNLQADRDYILQVFPFNASCIGGPLYASHPGIFEIHTPPTPPSPGLVSCSYDAVQIGFAPSFSGKNILVGTSNKEGGTSELTASVETKAWQQGDTLVFLPSGQDSVPILCLYAGAIPENGILELSGLKESNPYYFYVWMQTEDGAYTPEYRSLKARTWGHAPLTFDFDSELIPQPQDSLLPAGWSESTNTQPAFRITETSDHIKTLALDLTTATQAYRADCITPVFDPAYSALKVECRIRLTSSTGTSSSFIQFPEGDSLLLQYRPVSSSEWNHLETWTLEDILTYEEDNFARIESRAYLSEQSPMQLRFVACGKAHSGIDRTVLSIQSVLVEPELPCAYPQNIRINEEETTHRIISLEWDYPRSSPSATLFRYRKSGDTAWSPYAESQTLHSLQLRGTSPNTPHVFEIRALCAATDSSLPRQIEVSSLRSLPYLQDLTNRNELPEGMSARFATLPAVGKPSFSEESFMHNGFKTGIPSLEGHTSLGAPADGSSWLLLPTLCLEDQTAPASLRFSALCYTQDALTGENGPVDTSVDSRVFILVSPDDSLNASKIIDTLSFQELSGNRFQNIEIDLSGFSRQIHIALAIDNSSLPDAMDRRSYFVIDSIRVSYTGDIPCPPVENIRQSSLTEDGIHIAWNGSAVEYALYLTQASTGKTDTFQTRETELSLSGLEPGNLYLYQIQTFCEEDFHSPGMLSDEGFFTTLAGCTPPSGFSVVSTTWQSVVISGHSPYSRQIHLRAKDTETYPDANWLLQWPSSNDTLRIEGLSAHFHIPYLVALRSICGEGDTSDWTEYLEFTTDMPECGKPENLSSDPTDTDAFLSWDAGSNNLSFLLLLRADPDTEADSIPLDRNEYHASDLRPETVYHWQVQGVCEGNLLSEASRASFPTSPSGNEEFSSRQGFQISITEGGLRIFNPDGREIRQVEVFGLDGKKLLHANPDSKGDVVLPLPASTTGLLLVRIHSEGKVFVEKAFSNLVPAAQ